MPVRTPPPISSRALADALTTFPSDRPVPPPDATEARVQAVGLERAMLAAVVALPPLAVVLLIVRWAMQVDPAALRVFALLP